MKLSKLVVGLALWAPAVAAGEITLEITGITDGVDPIPQFLVEVEVAITDGVDPVPQITDGVDPIPKVLVGILDDSQPVSGISIILGTIVDDPDPIGLNSIIDLPDPIGVADVVDEPDPFGDDLAPSMVASHFSIIDLPDPVSGVAGPIRLVVTSDAPLGPHALLVVATITEGADPMAALSGPDALLVVPVGSPDK